MLYDLSVRAEATLRVQSAGEWARLIRLKGRTGGPQKEKQEGRKHA
jgi:hypothetical protein